MKMKLMAMLLAAGAVFGAWAHNVSLAKGTEDAANWTISPTEADEGAQVTVAYTGEKTLKSVTAKKAAAEPVSLATPLTMEALTDGTIKVNMSSTLSTGMKYSVNGGAKALITTTTTIDVTKGDKVQFYGNGTSTQVYGYSPVVKLLGTAQTKVYGNIMSLVDETGYETATTLPVKNYVFYCLFDGNATLTDASGLLLPATTLAYGCYWCMFRDCTGLTAAPALPATTLANYCYADMFRGCTGLTMAPALPATTLADSCYQSMFYGCTALTTAPALPATTLTGYCYFSMFSGCTSLSSVTCLATSGIDTNNSTDNWLYNVAATGTFAADGTATWPVGVNGIPSGWTRQEPVSLATPLTMEALTDGTIKVNIAGTLSTGMKYSVNGGAKMPITTTTTIDVLTGDKVQFYGNGTSTQVYGDSPEVTLLGTAQTKVYGNIMSLIDETAYATSTVLPSQNYVFYGLFDGNAALTDASGLLLPATTLVDSCYAGMFRYCTGLTAVPVLPATTLAEYCYAGMFYGCTALTAAPALPATTLADNCYFDMFYGCTSLSSVTCLATEGIDINNSTKDWLNGVAASGTFSAAGTATWPVGVNGIPSGWTRQDVDKVELTPTANASEWTFAMPAFDVELGVEYYSDQDFADVVIAAIAAIGDVAYTDESKAKIDAARAAYDALTPAQQALVANAATLTAAEAAYAALAPAPTEPAPENADPGSCCTRPSERVVLPELHAEVSGAVDLSVASTWDGYLRAADGSIAGTVQAKIAKAGKDNRSKVTCTLQPIVGKALKITGMMDAAGRFTLGAGTDLAFGADAVKGTAGGYAVDGSRSVFASKAAADKAAANAFLGGWKGVYPVAWKSGGWSALTVTVGAKGKAKVAGVLADGTKVSAGGQLAMGESASCVSVVSAKKKAQFAFVLWLRPEGVVVDGLGESAVVAKGVSNVPNGVRVTCDLLAAPAPVAAVGKKWVVTTDKETALSLTYTPKAGTFKGSFKVGKLKATVNGVVVDGKGYGSAVIKNAAPAPVTIE